MTKKSYQFFLEKTLLINRNSMCTTLTPHFPHFVSLLFLIASSTGSPYRSKNADNIFSRKTLSARRTSLSVGRELPSAGFIFIETWKLLTCLEFCAFVTEE